MYKLKPQYPLTGKRISSNKYSNSRKTTPKRSAWQQDSSQNRVIFLKIARLWIAALQDIFGQRLKEVKLFQKSLVNFSAHFLFPLYGMLKTFPSLSFKIIFTYISPNVPKCSSEMFIFLFLIFLLSPDYDLITYVMQLHTFTLSYLLELWRNFMALFLSYCSSSFHNCKCQNQELLKIFEGFF